ncbi:alkaline phosphatase D family protein [Nocardia sp. 2]|uniref:Alkaline phosphatase D family protein n=1 Tax=Nocardia acididurans TaxID=2802282 RepID=A0ABS1M7R8_9NOCA|nr:alkaline phosphatase D family protein [Nocardia acididurans]
MDRRTALKTGTTAALAGSAALLTTGRAAADSPVFRHGVASGDPLPTGVMLWTRVTPSEDALPGSGRGEAVTVRWEIATDAGFGSVAASGNHTATVESDHTVKVDAGGLAPATDYFYRFTALGQVSRIGRTRTAPGAQDTPDRLRFGVASCANYEEGWFAAYRHLAAREDLDAVIHLGDYLYEYARGAHAIALPNVRQHDPANEIVSLADYRIRHAQYKTDEHLANLHARVPFICTWDDHESANDAWRGGAENHSPATEGDWQARRAAALRAYLEWMPVRAVGTGAGAQLYRRLRFGTLAELSMLDLRSYRDQQLKVGAGWREVENPARTLTGAAQMEWLTAGLTTATAQWKLVGTSVMIAPLNLPTLDPTTAQAFAKTLGTPESGLPVNLDQWDGYAADRQRLFTALRDQSVRDVVFLTGDIHSSWAADLPVDAGEYPAGPTVGAEFVVPSVSMGSIGDFTHLPPRTVSVALENTIRAMNHHMQYAELDSHGYGVLHVDSTQAQMDWFYVSSVTDPNAGVRHGASRAVPTGGRMESRTAPMA